MVAAGKHKRSDRGSVEEVTCCTKNSSMTDHQEETPTTTGDENITPSEEEPSLREIKNLLISIQASVSGIFKENQDLKKELADLKNSVAFNDKDLQETENN